jgi:hypothetical protein
MQDFGVDGVAALEAQPELRLVATHDAQLGAEAMRVLCAVLGRPRVAGGLVGLSLWCGPHFLRAQMNAALARPSAFIPTSCFLSLQIDVFKSSSRSPFLRRCSSVSLSVALCLAYCVVPSTPHFPPHSCSFLFVSCSLFPHPSPLSSSFSFPHSMS